MLAAEQFNPMYHFVTYFRGIALWNTVPSLQEHLICFAFAAITFVVGVLVFPQTPR